MGSRTYVLIGSAAGLVLLAFWFVWPTPYEYTRKFPDIYRVNRFSGVQEKATEGGWVTLRELDRRNAVAELEAKAKYDLESRERLAEADKLFRAVTFYVNKGTTHVIEGYNSSEWGFDLSAVALVVYYAAGSGERIYSKQTTILDTRIPPQANFEIDIIPSYEALPKEVREFRSEAGYRQEVSLEVRKATPPENHKHYDPLGIYLEGKVKRTITRYFERYGSD